jgi:hypothetical protein
MNQKVEDLLGQNNNNINGEEKINIESDVNNSAPTVYMTTDISSK